MSYEELVEHLLENENEKESWFYQRTKNHIDLVIKSAKQVVEVYPEFQDLMKQVKVHDAIKFEEPEKTPYVQLTWNKKIGQPTNTPEMMQATFHHVKNSPHHPEYWANEIGISSEDRDKSTKCIDASKMSDSAIAEMVCDWQAMATELGTNSARQWYDKCNNVRWSFSDKQNELIDRLLKVFEEEQKATFEEMNESTAITKIDILATEGTIPDAINKIKFTVHMISGKMYQYEAVASPRIMWTFIVKVEKKQYGRAMTFISPYILDYKRN